MAQTTSSQQESNLVRNGRQAAAARHLRDSASPTQDARDEKSSSASAEHLHLTATLLLSCLAQFMVILDRSVYTPAF
jgi:hypothetical protein